jgi:CHASE2 domain-containing sensor protein
MSESNRQLLTIGVFFVAFVVAILLAFVVLENWVWTIPLFLLFAGLWLTVLGAMRSNKTVKYERSSFSTIALGLCSIAVGGAWFLFSYGWVYSLALILLVIGALAIAAALKRK